LILVNTIFIRELRLPAWIGLYAHEKIAPQTIEIELDMQLASDEVFRSGKVRDTIDYGVVVQRIKSLLEQEHFGLVESLAERIAGIVLEDFAASRVKITITKLGVLREARRVGVVIERSSPRSSPT
jgi:dihydroneopterin aldolase